MKTKLEFFLDDNDDSFYDDKITLNAHLKGPELALCIYSIKQQLCTLMDQDKLEEREFDILMEYIFDSIGSLDQYTR